MPLAEVKRKDMLRVFRSLDPKQLGVISHSQLHSGLKKFHPYLQEGQLRALSKSVDSADTGMVDYHRLVEVFKQDQAPAVDTYIQSCQSRPWGVVKPW
jgi:Ca2+-binding EF-hand superfamily protein